MLRTPRHSRRFLRFAQLGGLSAMAGVLLAACRTDRPLSPPDQPPSGPGGADYAHATVAVQRAGTGAAQYWLFTPADPVPDTAPLVVFLHGWGGTNPRCYSAWIAHLVRKGQIVVYPRYQENLTTAPSDMIDGAATGVIAAWQALGSAAAPRPDSRGIAIVTHSLGGLLAVQIADRLTLAGLPAARVVLLTHPGGQRFVDPATPQTLAADCLALVVVGDADTQVGDTTGEDLLARLAGVLQTGNVELVRVPSDDRSTPPLVADHYAPLAVDFTLPADDLVSDAAGGGGPCETVADGSSPLGSPDARPENAPNTLDFYGYWKLADGLLDAAFRDTHREYALGNTPEQRSLGYLSDGTPVTPLTIEPPAPP